MWFFITAFVFFWFGFLMAAMLSAQNQNNKFDPWNDQHPDNIGYGEEPMDKK